MDWLDYVPLANTVIIAIAVPIIAGLRRLRKEDLEAINRRFDKLEQRIDTLFVKSTPME